MRQRVLLVGVARSNRMRWAKADSLDELAALTDTAGGEVVERLVQVRKRLDPATLVGRGLAELLGQACREHDIELVVFDEELTPTQQRNLEQGIARRVVDRAALILDIFALHARTAEAKIQVELAQLEYQQSRLVGRGTELSRLGGGRAAARMVGIGARGPGETKLEVDRRRIQQRIVSLRRELAKVDRERATQSRRRAEQFRVVLIGYTNAGKSSLFNRLTDARVKVSARLFATLDPSTRGLDLDRNVRVMLTDTVGFIRSLPHQLVASFRATLGEVRDADLLLHVVDASDDQVERRVDVVNDTLADVGGGGTPVLIVFNKSDRVFDETAARRLRRCWAGSVLVSALTGAGLNRLQAAMLRIARRQMVTRTFTVPDGRLDLISAVLGSGQVVRDESRDGRRRLSVRGFPGILGRTRKEVERALGRRG